MAQIAVLIPAFNEEAGLAQVVEEVCRQLDALGHRGRVLLIDDGSADRTWEVIQSVARTHAQVAGLRLSRNFGKEAALLAGLDTCDADCVLVMDADLQHPPSVIPRLVEAWEHGFQVVHGVKFRREGESWFRRSCSGLVFSLARFLSGLDLRGSSDFKLLDRAVVRRYREFRENHLFFRGLVDWLGFRSIVVHFDVGERLAGTSQWGLWGLVSYAANAVLSFSAKPLRLVALLAGLVLLVSTTVALVALLGWLRGRSTEGFPALLLLTVAFGNVGMVAAGVMSWYVAKIFEEVKSRPRYVVAQAIPWAFDEDKTTESAAAPVQPSAKIPVLTHS